MRDNWNVQVASSAGVLLRPYMRSLVKTYHSWMEDEALREATASERLSLDEELAMQRSWATDPDKLTFIVFASAEADPRTLPSAEGRPADAAGWADDVAWDKGMVGDVNLFFLEDDDDETAAPGSGAAGAASEGEEAAAPSRSSTAEVMVMTADTSVRRGGVATSAVAMTMTYAAERLGVRRFVAKISTDNVASIRLFTTRLGFAEFKRVPAFEEVHLHVRVTDPAWLELVTAATGGCEVSEFANPETVE